MSETGFGSLSYNPLPEYNDWGFGSPTPTEMPISLAYGTQADWPEKAVGQARDTGFGSPYDPYNAPVEIPGEFALIPDDGGVQLEIIAPWYQLGLPLGRGQYPMRVTIISQDTGEETLALGRVDRATCLTNFTRTILFAGIPPLPRGSYDLLITWDDGMHSLSIPDAFTVAMRPRSSEVYAIKKNMPQWYKAGPRDFVEESDVVYGKESNVGAILGAFGQQLQGMAGRPLTATREHFVEGDTSLQVESTIGFPSEGAIFVADRKFTYTSKTERSFDGVVTDYYISVPIRKKERVVLDAKSVK